MTRVKRGSTKLNRRRNVLSQVKGYRYGRSTKKRQAREAIAHAGLHAFAHRKDKKGDFRRLWNIRINAAVRALGATYSTLINKMKGKKIAINRKMLSQIAREHPETFERIVKEAN